MIFVATILHTGTHSFLHSFDNYEERKRAKEIVHQHFTFTSLQPYVTAADKVYVTYRNPYRVAASWANRHRLPELRNRRGERNWYAQWESWANLVQQKKTQVVSVNDLALKHGMKPDSHELHPMLDKGNYDEFFICVPKKAVDFAMEIIHDLQACVPGSLETQ